jgi:hypothetical protein
MSRATLENATWLHGRSADAAAVIEAAFLRIIATPNGDFARS